MLNSTGLRRYKILVIYFLARKVLTIIHVTSTAYSETDQQKCFEGQHLYCFHQVHDSQYFVIKIDPASTNKM